MWALYSDARDPRRRRVMCPQKPSSHLLSSRPLYKEEKGQVRGLGKRLIGWELQPHPQILLVLLYLLVTNSLSASGSLPWSPVAQVPQAWRPPGAQGWIAYGPPGITAFHMHFHNHLSLSTITEAKTLNSWIPLSQDIAKGQGWGWRLKNFVTREGPCIDQW